MVGDRLEVQTLRAGRQTQPISIEIAGEGSLFWFKTSERDTPGTSVRVRLDPAKSERKKATAPENLHVLVHRLAPHVDVPIEVSEGRTARVPSSWTLDGDPEKYKPAMTRIEFPFATANGGLDGHACVFIVTCDGKLEYAVRWKSATGEVDRPVEAFALREIPEDVIIEHSFWEAEIQMWDPDELANATDWDPELLVHSTGIWSQQGFAVARPILGWSSDRLYRSNWIGSNDVVRFPFPIYYDLDIIRAPFFPLTADRNSIADSLEADLAGRAVSHDIAVAFFRALGTERVTANLEFLRSPPTDRYPDYHQTLQGFLAAS
jgi:hypothetical protein